MMGLSRIERLRRAWPVIVALSTLLGVLLASPSLRGGPSADDHIQRMWVRERGQCLDLFGFATGDEALLNFQKSVGTVPFYADPKLKISFFRPLASLSHCLDYRYLDGYVEFYHLQNLFWFGLVVVAASVFYRKTTSVLGASALATLFFAIDDAHGPSVGWIANRNALMATAFGTLSFILHDRARREASRVAAWISPLAFLLALLSAEAGVAVLGYLIAYACVLDRGGKARRAYSLLPYGVILVGWRIAYVALDHGQYGSLLYTDPITSPWQFLVHLTERVPVLLFSQLGVSVADTFTGADMAQRKQIWAIGIVSVMAMAALLVPLFRARKSARFFALGMLLSIIPAAATEPGDRLLLFAGLGGMGLVGETLVSLVDVAQRVYRGRPLRMLTSMLGLFWLLAHGILAPFQLPGRSLTFSDRGDRMKTLSESLFADIDDETGVVVLYADDMYTCTFALFMGYALGHAGTSRGQCLYGGPSAVEIVRIGAKRLLVRPEKGFIEPGRAPFWNADKPMREGEKIGLGWSSMTMTAVSEKGEPLEAVVQFSKAFEDPSLRLRYFDKKAGRYLPIEPPPLWGSLRIDGEGIVRSGPP